MLFQYSTYVVIYLDMVGFISRFNTKESVNKLKYDFVFWQQNYQMDANVFMFSQYSVIYRVYTKR